MPKTIAITPSWFWPESVDRVAGIPPYGVSEFCVARHARYIPDSPAIIAGSQELSFSQLHARVLALSEKLLSAGPDSKRAVLSGAMDAANMIRLLAALKAGFHIRVVPVDEDLADAKGLFSASINLSDEEVESEAVNETAQPIPELEALRSPAVAIPGDACVINHSHRSLLAGVISTVTFLQPQDRPWLGTIGLDRWEGLLSALTPLYLGVPLILNAESQGFAETIQQHQPGYAVEDLSTATLATREDKRAVKKARGILDAVLLSTPGVFNSGDRQRVAKSFRCSSLTFFGKPETGTIFASHPQWYLDESVGIPVTNAHVVPSDPRNGAPIQALWELVESAEVTVKGPMLMCGYEGGDNEDHYVDGRYRTGVIASSDANGMIYVLPD
ncbi:MAG: hypothetical protein CMQ20_16295 [Gammaproteobacteria bacterium]|jgi:acyl-CoA synthetase (AMP-forming)/AMP-acid ligase II|nr:hypothetical protein [Gammaproteobacteria bacterium]|tara:strand:- start:793 stop:1953 length:1161 start_codon:yes stop_codon:yes gene_type:complete